jgi:hypothetical protein
MENTYTPLTVPDNCSIIQLPARNLDATVERELSLRRVRVIEILNPFRPDDCKVTELDALENESLGALLARVDYAVEQFEASVNGDRVEAAEVWRTVVSAGQEVVLYPRSGGGAMRSFALMLPLIAIALITGIGVPFIGFGAMMGLGATATNILAAAVAIGGSMLVSWALRPGTPHQPAYSSTYDPAGPKGLAAPGTPVPKGNGKMGWCGNIISSFVDFDGPNAYIYALACYGFGRATTVGNIKLNGKPISEYMNCTYQVRLGHNDQTPIDGFNRTVNGFPQETELKVSNGAVTVPGTGTNVQGLQVTVKFPNGLYRVTDKGNYVPLKSIYTIKISPHGLNTWSSPLFPNFTKSIATTHADGSLTWPAWVVVPTDRFAGSGIVYAYDNGTHTPGDAWTHSMRVSTVDVDGNTSDADATFTGKWMPCDPALEQVEVQTWQQGYRVVKNDTLSAFFDTVTIYGLTSGKWDVQVQKIGYEQDNENGWVVYADSTDAKHVCDVWLWNVNEVVLSDLCYPNMILVGVQALATSQMSGANLQISADVQHDLGEDTLLPFQLTGFEHDNPALVAYDVLTNPLYGMGVSASLIDVPAFVAWAEFCDELVTNQDGSQVRRFIFNGIFDQAGDAWKVLSTIGNMSRAAVIQIGMRYSVVLDAPAVPVQLFTVGNTKRNSFQESWVALDDRATLVECDFADAARNYRMDLPVSVMTADDLNSGVTPKPTRTKLVGCTSRDQAWRWAYFHLLSTKLSLRFIQFEAAIEACCCRVGSVIAVQTDVTKWATGGRILYGSTVNTVNVDRTDLTFAPSLGYTVSVQHPVIARGTATVQNVTGLTVTMTAALPAGRILKAVGPDGTEYVLTGAQGSAITVAKSTGALAAGQAVTLYDVNVIEQLQVTAYTVNPDGSATLQVFGNFQGVPVADCAWAYGQSAGYQPAKLFRVTQMKKSGDFNFQISGVEYNAEVYTDVVPNYGEIVGVPDTTPAILNLSITEQFQNGALTGSKDSALVCVGWMNSNTAVGGKVEVQANGGTWGTLGNIQGQGCTFAGTVGTTYTVRVTGFDWQGNLLGNPVSASLTVVAASNAPADVTNFTGSPGSGQTILSWSAVSGADHYEIRYTGELGGAGTWDNSEVLWDGTGTTWTDNAVRSGIYMIVAVSSLATGSIESVNPATWQYQNATGGTGINPDSIDPKSVVWPMCGVYITSAGGTLTSLSPYGLGINRQGLQINIPNENIVLNFSGALTASTTYFAYFYLDTNLDLRSPNGGTADVGYNNAHASTAVSNGVLAWYYSFTTDASGHANNPEMDVHTISL